jgi:DNA repair exonuclease SbcCD ATPase subunit
MWWNVKLTLTHPKKQIYMVNNSKNKIKIYWDDLPENYSKELKGRVGAYFANKYNVPKTSVNVIFRATRKDKAGNVIEINDAGVDNIMDINYQRELMKKWLELGERKVNLDRLFKLDDKINTDVNFTSSEKKHRRWGIKWLEINNFLCFGDKNHVSFDRFDGLNVVNSEPANQGGKTTFNIDTVKFLLFGNTTKTEKNEQIFNKFRNEDTVSVKGELSFGGENVIIERKLTRKEKNGGGYTVTNKVKYYQILPDGDEDELNAEDATATTKLITETVGKEADFDITTLATANNLEDLIELKPAANGKLLNRFIGLEIIDEKLAAVRKRYNDFNSKKLGNTLNIITLKDEIEELDTKKDSLESLLETHKETIVETTKKIGELNDEKDRLLSNKIRVDDELLKVNTATLENNLHDIKVKGTEKRATKAELEAEVKALGEIKFDEDKYDEITKKKNTNDLQIRNNNSDIQRLKSEIDSLLNDEICGTCKRPLDDVDNSKEVTIKEGKITELTEKTAKLTTTNDGLIKEIETLNQIKVNADKKDRLEVSIDKLDVDLGGLLNDYKTNNDLLKKYTENKEAIDINKQIDADVEQVKTKLRVEENKKDETNDKINRINIELATIDKDVKTKQVQIKKINAEEEVERIFKIYIEMYGKKGISKMVLKSVLPIINSELVRLMEDVCNFTIELDINSKNDVEYMIVMGGTRSSLKSGSGLEKTIASLALRTVLGKMAYLPMPNFITFDEVTGKVAAINIPHLEGIFNKIKELYDMVFLITHNDLVKDWGDNVITIKKDEVTNVSTINIK